jgi:hypothetical protein
VVSSILAELRQSKSRGCPTDPVVDKVFRARGAPGVWSLHSISTLVMPSQWK